MNQIQEMRLSNSQMMEHIEGLTRELEDVNVCSIPDQMFLKAACLSETTDLWVLSTAGYADHFLALSWKLYCSLYLCRLETLDTDFQKCVLEQKPRC